MPQLACRHSRAVAVGSGAALAAALTSFLPPPAALASAPTPLQSAPSRRQWLPYRPRAPRSAAAFGDSGCSDDDASAEEPISTRLRRLADGGDRDGVVASYAREAPQDQHLWEPIRIRFFTEALAGLSARDRAAVADVLEATGRFLSEILSVRPVIGRLKLTKTCLAFNTVSGSCAQVAEGPGFCGLVEIPPAHVADMTVCSDGFDLNCQVIKGGAGIPAADVAIYVGSRDVAKCSSGAGAYAEVCSQDQEDRPIGGFINICPASLGSFSTRWSLAVGMVLHEILHIFGIHDGFFPFYRTETGEPRTRRDRFGMPPSDQSQRAVADSGTIRIEEETRGSGGEHRYVTLPRTLAVAREHFGCARLDGVPLEEESSGEGSAFSHWNDRFFQRETMTPETSANGVLSVITLALLHDSGWYRPSYRLAGDLAWGQGRGCAFIEGACIKDGATTFPGTFCTQSSGRCNAPSWEDPSWGCSADLTFLAVCNLCEHRSLLPADFRHFPSNDRLGGYSQRMGYCPFWQAVKPCSRSSPSVVASTGESYNVNSRCIMADAVKQPVSPPAQLAPTCREIICDRADGNGGGSGGLSVRVDSLWIRCEASDVGLIKQVNDSLWRGSIQCPHVDRICGGGPSGDGPRLFQGVARCAFPGHLRHGRCVCPAGYMNEDCEVQDTSGNREAQPFGLRYPVASLSLALGVPLERSPRLSAWPFRPRLAAGPMEVSFSVSPPLPEGLALAPRTGAIDGTPTAAAARSEYTIRAQGSGGAAATTTLTIAVSCTRGSTLCILSDPPVPTGTFEAPSPATIDEEASLPPRDADRLRIVTSRRFADLQDFGMERFFGVFAAALSSALGSGLRVAVDSAVAVPPGQRAELECRFVDAEGSQAASSVFSAVAATLRAGFAEEDSALRLKSAFGISNLDEDSALFTVTKDGGIEQLWPPVEGKRPFWKRILEDYWWASILLVLGCCCCICLLTKRGYRLCKRIAYGACCKSPPADGRPRVHAFHDRDLPEEVFWMDPPVAAECRQGLREGMAQPQPTIIGDPVVCPARPSAPDAAMESLMEMGFTYDKALAALERNRWDVAAAAADASTTNDF